MSTKKNKINGISVHADLPADQKSILASDDGANGVLSEEDILPSNTKVRISMMIDGDVLEAAKAHAKAHSAKYQTVINDFLRQKFLESSNSLESRIQNLEKSIQLLDSLKKEVSLLKRQVRKQA